MGKRRFGITIWAALFGIPLLAHAQTGSPPAKDKVIYTKNSRFGLPVKIDQRFRDNIQEVLLYVKPPNGEWVRKEVGPSSIQQFTYTATEDGEYWFNIATADKAGKMSPADVKTAAPALKVMVDTRPPVVDVQQWEAPDGEVCLRCTVQDATADTSSLKIFYKGGDQIERALVPHPVHGSGTFRVPVEVLAGSVRVCAKDRCGNSVDRQVSLKDPFAAAGLPPSGANTSQSLKAAQVGTEPEVPAPPPPMASAEPPTLAPRGTDFQSPQVPVPPAPSYHMASPPPVSPWTTPAPAQGAPNVAGAHAPPNPPAPFQAGIDAARPSNANAPSSLGGTTPCLVLNALHAAVEYRIDQVGPSGVGKVEVYVTTDQGQNWRRLCEDADRRSPAELDLPGEGLFGIRLVITNGNGFGGKPPVRGDAPTFAIEVDTTSPFVQLRDVEPVVGHDGTLEIRWTASDKNLSPEPITLSYATSRGGPWQIIARSLKNDGTYRWPFPRNVGGQFFFKVEAINMVGNFARVESSQPLVLDMTEPRGTVVGITGLQPRPVPPPHGN